MAWLPAFSWEMVSAFSFYYPLFMAYLWMTGAIYYFFRYERTPTRDVNQPPKLAAYPKVSVVVPCFNEEGQIEEVMASLMNLNYPNFNVVAVNDGSSDRTGELLDQLNELYPNLRVIHLAKNQGKAIALNTGCQLTDAEYVVCIDGDAMLDPCSIDWLMMHMDSPRVAAVTGNPRVRTRSTLLGRIQVGEFSSIVGLIKRAQRTYGRLFTVSGVVALFRQQALREVGYWSPNMLTEDVDISWKLQSRHWDVRFEPRALCWILMPETLRGLWRQRLRWAMGGTQVLMHNFTRMLSWRQRRMWPVYIEFSTSVLWAYAMAAIILLWFWGTALDFPVPYNVPTVLPQWTGVVVGTTCLLQVALSLMLDSHYDRGLKRHFFWMIWYPLLYWLLNVVTTIVAVPRVLWRGNGKRARWKSPDRGLRPQT